MIETLTVARSTSLSPARQNHGGRFIPTLHWMLAHPPLPVANENCGAHPALIGLVILRTILVVIIHIVELVK